VRLCQARPTFRIIVCTGPSTVTERVRALAPLAGPAGRLTVSGGVLTGESRAVGELTLKLPFTT